MSFLDYDLLINIVEKIKQSPPHGQANLLELKQEFDWEEMAIQILHCIISFICSFLPLVWLITPTLTLVI